MRLVVTILAVAAFGAQGQSGPRDFHVWKAADIAAKGSALAQKVNAQKVATEPLGTQGNRTFIVARREGTGVAERHEKEADVVFVSDGNATMVYGGTIVDAKTVAPGETRGPSIRGGTEVPLGPGDVMHIPATVAHHVKLAPGKHITYFLTKIVE
jgi:mannose-6-phosphate isomerase-like protein (cupin superfamily)